MLLGAVAMTTLLLLLESRRHPALALPASTFKLTGLVVLALVTLVLLRAAAVARVTRGECVQRDHTWSSADTSTSWEDMHSPLATLHYSPVHTGTSYREGP